MKIHGKVLPSAEAEVLPGSVTRADRLGYLDGQPFVHEVLTQWSESSGLPVRVVTACLVDQRTHLTATRWRGIADGMSELMGQPEREQLGIETKPLRVRVGDGGEMLQACKGDPCPAHHQLAGVCRTNADHQHDVHVGVLFEQTRAPLLGRPREGDDVSALEHLAQVRPVGQRSGASDVTEVGAVRIDDVVVPVGLEDSAVGFEITLVGGDAIGAIEYSEKIRQQVDQHSTGKRPAGDQRRTHQRRGRRSAGATDAV